MSCRAVSLKKKKKQTITTHSVFKPVFFNHGSRFSEFLNGSWFDVGPAELFAVVSRLTPLADRHSAMLCPVSAASVDYVKIIASSVAASVLVSCCCCVKRCCCKKSKKDEAETPGSEAAVNLQEVRLQTRPSLVACCRWTVLKRWSVK